MIANQRSAAAMETARFVVLPHDGTIVGDWVIRAIQIALAFYLLPVLLVMLAMGGLGMLLLGISRYFIQSFRGSLG